MTSAGETHYRAYRNELDRTNAKPEIIQYAEPVHAFCQASGMYDLKPASHSTKFWDRGEVYYLDDGRVVERTQTNSACYMPVIAVFANKDDHSNYRKAMPLNTYLWG